MSGVDTTSKEDAKAAGDYVEFTFTTGSTRAQLSNWYQGLEPHPNSTGAGDYNYCLELSSDGFETSTVLIPDGYVPDPQAGGDNGPNTRVNVLVSLEQELEPNTAYCLLYTSPSPRDATLSRMPSSA